MIKLRVLIADDHDVVRAGVRSLLKNQPDCAVCGEATTGREVVALATQIKPDVVVMDITMPELNGLEAARQILDTVPNARILILSVHESEVLVREILDTGAHGYILKSDAGRELVAALRALGRGETFFTSKVAQIALRAYLNKEDTGAELSPRERQVLQMLAEGKTSKEVAGVLDITVQTVDRHRANIMQKLNLHTITELVHYAVRNKIVPC